MKINVRNFDDGETLTFHLPLLIGDVESPAASKGQGHISVCNTSYPQFGHVEWPVVDDSFKALVRVGVGENKIELTFDGFTSTISLVRIKSPLIHFVRPIYIVCANDDGYFQGPDDEDVSPESALNRIRLGAMIIQSFTAEKMKEHGFGRKTFQLETDGDCEPICRKFPSKLTLEEAQGMTGNELWTYFAKEIMNCDLPNKDKCKWYSFMSFTRYFPPSPEEALPKTHGEILKYTKGHTALGGGGLALFGTGNLHTWAASVDQVYARFTDNRKIDRSKLMDDSAYREYYWANYATGLGASLHELGHTFDLPHTPTGIMARGFDDIYKVFTIRKIKKHCNKSRQRYHSGSRTRTSSTSSLESTNSEDSQATENKKGQGHVDNLQNDSNTKVPKENLVDQAIKREGQVTKNIEGEGQATGDKKNQVTHTHESVSIKQTLDLKQNVQPKHREGKNGVPFGSPLRRKDPSRSQTFIAPPPVVVAMETGFKPVKSPSTLTFSVKNYDGSERRQTVSVEGGFETVTDLVMSTEGHLISKSARRDRANSCSSVSSSSSVHSPMIAIPSMLPNSPEEPLIYPEITFKDGGAHWYRSSAVTLFFHKWFNDFDPNGDGKSQISISGSHIQSQNGIRLVELRSEPDGVVFHHYEFLKDTPPTRFTLKVSSVKNLPQNNNILTVQTEDSFGHIARKKMNLDDFER